MTIKEINIENFKCFEKFEIETKKLTLFTGANSSGKSSLLYSFLGPIQSEEFPLQFSPNGKYVRMGDFGDIVHFHDNSKQIKLNYKYSQNNQDYSIQTVWEEDKIRKLPTLVNLLAKSDYFDIEITKKYKYHLSFKYSVENDPYREMNSPEMIKKLLASVKSITTEFTKSKKNKDNYKDEWIDDFLSKYTSPKKSIKFSFDSLNELGEVLKKDGNYYLDNFFKGITSFFNNIDKKTNFISSFRLLPERTYYETSKTDLKIGKYGENYVDQIILWESIKSNKLNELKEIIRELGLFYDIKTERLGGGRYELLVKSNKNGVWASITDVGFGISQFLPIIVADIQLGDKSTLFIAQPEIHLHPKIQALFANYLINNINKKNKTYLIETHSEYLINRLRLEIVKDNFDSKNVKTYFIENKGDKVKSYDIKFIKNGQIKGAPKSFFDTYMMDSMNITLEAL
jgi:predicted ATPase